MDKIKIWWLAWICDYPFFIVTYPDGKKTRPLYQAEAFGLRDVFNGTIKIDYDYGRKFLGMKI